MVSIYFTSISMTLLKDSSSDASAINLCMHGSSTGVIPLIRNLYCPPCRDRMPHR